jgi:hypothetical protein
MLGSRKSSSCPSTVTNPPTYANVSDRVLCNVLYCAKINRDKANGKYDKYIGYGDDRDPEFKLVL